MIKNSPSSQSPLNSYFPQMTGNYLKIDIVLEGNTYFHFSWFYSCQQAGKQVLCTTHNDLDIGVQKLAVIELSQSPSLQSIILDVSIY